MTPSWAWGMGDGAWDGHGDVCRHAKRGKGNERKEGRDALSCLFFARLGRPLFARFYRRGVGLSPAPLLVAGRTRSSGQRMWPVRGEMGIAPT